MFVMKRKRLISASVLLAVMITLVSGAELDSLLLEAPEKRWETTPEMLAKTLQVPLRWVSARKDALRYSADRAGNGITFAGLPVQEVIFQFQNRRLREVYISVYNRGDAGIWDEERFEDTCKAVEKAVTSALKGQTPGRDRGRLAGETIYMRYWQTPQGIWYLRWSESDKIPEYLTLKLCHPSLPFETIRQSLRADAGNFDGKAQVRTGSDGSRYLDVPMIDQGRKGYCVAATVARIMRYYGSEVDQHEIAQLADTDAAAGTSLNAIEPALERARSKLKVKFEMLYDCDYFESYDGVLRFISAYNNAARSLKKERLQGNRYIEVSGRRRTIRLDRVLQDCDPEVVKAARMRDRREYRDFQEAVKSHIDRGIPLMLVIPGHMRIINGYNAKTGEIIYTDSFGAGHEKKTMKFEDTWVNTLKLMIIEPR